MEKVKVAANGTRSLMTADLPPLPSITSATPPSWTAPARSAPPVSASSVAASQPARPAPHPPAVPNASASNPAAILDELVRTVEGVRSAILASVDGFGLARSSSMSDEASHPAMLAAAIGLAHQLAVVGGGSQLRQLVVDHDGGLMLVWPIGEHRVLAVLATSSVEQRRVRSFVQARASSFVGASS
jgi:predicted regulator of Ras-like GTPase activity (Roadblock/LC7/MglB family)